MNDSPKVTMTDGSPVYEGHKELRPDGQQRGYIVLSEEERAKGFIRPVRNSYVHVGPPGPKFPLVDLPGHAPENEGYVKYEPYPSGHKGSSLGRYWTQSQLDRANKGCGVRTVMGQALAETYARSPYFYGGTFCVGCGTHFPVGPDGEFIWDGTTERVGT